MQSLNKIGKAFYCTWDSRIKKNSEKIFLNGLDAKWHKIFDEFHVLSHEMSYILFFIEGIGQQKHVIFRKVTIYSRLYLENRWEFGLSLCHWFIPSCHTAYHFLEFLTVCDFDLKREAIFWSNFFANIFYNAKPNSSLSFSPNRKPLCAHWNHTLILRNSYTTATSFA